LFGLAWSCSIGSVSDALDSILDQFDLVLLYIGLVCLNLLGRFGFIWIGDDWYLKLVLSLDGSPLRLLLLIMM
jgi:hypothetical protein